MAAMGRRSGVARCFLSSLPAACGGEEARKSGSPLLELGLGSCLPRWRCFCWRSSWLLSFLACCGGEEEFDGRVASLSEPPRLLPARCYGAMLSKLLCVEHMPSMFDAVILGWLGGPISTSIVEALIGSLPRSLAVCCFQVVHPCW
jgi:hypothetical protein